jgi:DNA-binding response OmpR family regulator
MRILLVSPPHAEAAYLHKAFQESAHSVQRVDDRRDAGFLASQEPFDAIVVVAVKPWSCAVLLEWLPELAAVRNRAALIAILGPATAQERVSALRAGADACFGQPYSFIELQERMQALQRTALPTFTTIERTTRPSLQLDALTRELVDGNHRVAVTKREYLLLECLMRQLNAPVPRETLIRYGWPDKEDVDPASVNLVVSRLRRKLEQHLPDAQIETVSRFGYQLAVSG